MPQAPAAPQPPLQAREDGQPNSFVPAMAGLVEAAGQGRVPRCLQPWQSLMIEVSGAVQPCAYRGNYTNTRNAEPLGNLNEQSLEEIWNGPVAQRVRRSMAAGDLEAAGCADCLALRQGQELGLEFDTAALGDGPSAYADNLAEKVGEILEGAERCRSRPTVLYYTPDHRCNLACLHCYQNVSRKQSVARRSASDEVLALLPYLSDVVAGGGEPLILPFWRRFLASPAHAINPYLRFSTTTNATVLREDVVEQIGRFRRISIIVSLDGATAETFETVRQRARWEPFLRNARRLRDLCSEKNAFFSFNISTMKSNLHELAALVRLCARFEAPFNYQPVVAYPAAQSLRCLNDPRREMAGWRTALTDAAEALETDYIPALQKAGREGRAVWTDAFGAVSRNHVTALEALIPWHLLAEPLHECVGALPEDFRIPIAENRARVATIRKGGEGDVVLFFPETDPPGAEPHFYAPLDGKLSFRVFLPEGRFKLSVVVQDAALGVRASAWDDLTFVVSGQGPPVMEVRFLRRWKTLARRWLGPLAPHAARVFQRVRRLARA